MTSFDDRKTAFENKFVLDQQQQFRAEAKACKALGLWAATQMGLSGEAATSYAHDLVVANLDEPGLEDVIDKVMVDFKTKGVTQDRAAVAAELRKLYDSAVEAVRTETRS